MATIASLKEQVIAQTPLLLFEAELAGGVVERWSTHAVTVDGEDFAPRVLRHNFFEVQAASDEVKYYIHQQLTQLLADPQFDYAVASQAQGNTQREALIIQRLEALAACKPQ